MHGVIPKNARRSAVVSDVRPPDWMSPLFVNVMIGFSQFARTVEIAHKIAKGSNIASHRKEAFHSGYRITLWSFPALYPAFSAVINKERQMQENKKCINLSHQH